MSARASQLRRQRDAYLDRIAGLEAELRKTRNSVFRKRKEIRLLIRQLAEWKADHISEVDRAKELEGLRSKMARVKFNGKAAARQRDELLAAVFDHYDKRSELTNADLHLYEVATQLQIQLALPPSHRSLPPPSNFRALEGKGR